MNTTHDDGISIIAPAHEEAGNLPDLVRRVSKAFSAHRRWELIVVDDGSRDDTASILAALQRETANLRVLRHAERCGQSKAMCTGADAARHSWLGFLDADGQNDPADLARLYREMLDAGERAPGMIMGRRRRRQDTWSRRASSRVANAVRAAILRDGTPDTGCSLKVLARRHFLAVPHFDHMHRFLPALLLHQGLCTVSRPVAHYPRREGRSKYGLGDRLWVGVMDLLGVWWLGRRRFISVEIEEQRPAREPNPVRE